MSETLTLDRPAPLVRAARSRTAPVSPSAFVRDNCATCSVAALCLPGGLSHDDLRPLESLFLITRRIREGETVYGDGDPFRFIYAVRRGTCKTALPRLDGSEQVTGFHMAGEVMGLEGLAHGVHATSATALEDSEVCLIPYQRLVAVTAATPGAKDLLTHLMSQEIVRDHSLMLMLGFNEAPDRLAAFLVNLSERYAARGYSPREYHLRMSRGEIASFLGLKLETISRTLSLFQRSGFIEVHGRHVKITDLEGLKQQYELRIR